MSDDDEDWEPRDITIDITVDPAKLSEDYFGYISVDDAVTDEEIETFLSWLRDKLRKDRRQ